MAELAAVGRSADDGKFLKVGNEQGTADVLTENVVKLENMKLQREKKKENLACIS